MPINYMRYLRQKRDEIGSALSSRRARTIALLIERQSHRLLDCKEAAAKSHYTKSALANRKPNR